MVDGSAVDLLMMADFDEVVEVVVSSIRSVEDNPIPSGHCEHDS